MKALLSLGLLLLSVSVQAKVFEQCEFARVMKKHGMNDFEGISLANWVCLAQHESHLNTKLTKNFGARVTVYGIFQISGEHWCDDGKTPKLPNKCGMPCSALLQDDITQAIQCAKIIVKSPEGMKVWSAWTRHCQKEDLTQYIKDCGV
ncbi:lysozyme C-1-like [Peromyscus californicus insignis]|uniref:lysozyme C-1-like n=1 Tax=Peromyscus californicus insignis TaxID=564181 RepID=UPI0022A6A207|nr:lysozyme C-1-like [Peromyscus californicus insignis]